MSWNLANVYTIILHVIIFFFHLKTNICVMHIKWKIDYIIASGSVTLCFRFMCQTKIVCVWLIWFCVPGPDFYFTW